MNYSVETAVTLTSPCLCFSVIWPVIELYLQIRVDSIKLNRANNILSKNYFSKYFYFNKYTKCDLLLLPLACFLCCLLLDTIFIRSLLSLKLTLWLLRQHINNKKIIFIIINIIISSFRRICECSIYYVFIAFVDCNLQIRILVSR